MSSLNSIFYTIRLMLSGRSFSSESADLKEYIVEVYDINDVPDITKDKESLRKDSKNVVGDYRKAFDIKKAEFQY